MEVRPNVQFTTLAERALRRERLIRVAESTGEEVAAAYDGDGEISRRLVDALPRPDVLRDDDWHCPRTAAARRRDRQGRPRPGGSARPARRHRSAELVHALRRTGLVPRAHRPGGGPGAAAAAQQPGPSVDRGRPRLRGERHAGGAGPAVHRPGRRAAAPGVPHRIAADARRRPPSARPHRLAAT
jgi:hypothetical protein